RDHKRGTTRIEAINDVFRLLDLRHEIHEKAVMHRVVQAANAMMSRSLLMIGERNRPGLDDIVRLGAPEHALSGEDSLFTALMERCVDPSKKPVHISTALEAHRVLLKLAERRVYRALMIVPGDRLARRLRGATDNRFEDDD